MVLFSFFLSFLCVCVCVCGFHWISKKNEYLYFVSSFSFIHQYIRGQYLLILRIGQPRAIQGKLWVNRYLLVQVEILLYTPLVSILPRPRPSTTKVNLYFHKPFCFFERVLTLSCLVSKPMIFSHECVHVCMCLCRERVNYCYHPSEMTK